MFVETRTSVVRESSVRATRRDGADDSDEITDLVDMRLSDRRE